MQKVTLSAMRRMRGVGRAAYEFDFSIGAAVVIFYWRPGVAAWRPMSHWGKPQTAAELALKTGLDEAQSTAAIGAAARICELEYLRQTKSALHLAA